MSTSSISALEARGWKFVRSEGCPTLWVPRRYGSLPTELVTFLESFSEFCSKDRKRWFIAANDYLVDSCPGFAWNEFERMSLAAACSDADWSREIAHFWQGHFPIFMSVDGSYSYAAYCCAGENCGRYIRGSEPQFEEVRIVASDLSGFLSWVERDGST